VFRYLAEEVAKPAFAAAQLGGVCVPSAGALSLGQNAPISASLVASITVDSGSNPRGEMRKPAKILNLASALAALAAPAAAPPIADAADSDGAHIATETEEGIQAEAGTGLPRGEELMSFIVHQYNDGMMFSQHQSHSSHVSHSSSSPNLPSMPDMPDMPDMPNMPDMPDMPYPNYPLPAVPPAAPTASPPPASASDITYLACSRASSGLGVNQIANELEQGYGIPENEAVNIARQALASVLAGGHYCDGYHGDGD